MKNDHHTVQIENCDNLRVLSFGNGTVALSSTIYGGAPSLLIVPVKGASGKPGELVPADAYYNDKGGVDNGVMLSFLSGEAASNFLSKLCDAVRLAEGTYAKTEKGRVETQAFEDAIVAPFKADLEGMDLAAIHKAMTRAQDEIDELQPWVEALAVQQARLQAQEIAAEGPDSNDL